jgi:signal transduction histidine kinase
VLTLFIAREEDVVTARQRARTVAAAVGLDAQDQSRVATSVSELARNLRLAGQKGRVHFSIEGTTSPQWLVVRVTELESMSPPRAASGDSHLELDLRPTVEGARRLMDVVEIGSPGGCEHGIIMKKRLPEGASLLSARTIQALTLRFTALMPVEPVLELQQQNRELLRALAELRDRQNDLVRLDRERELLLLSEHEARLAAERATRVKDEFLAMLSHELRTPMSTIQNWLHLLRSPNRTADQVERGILAIERAADAQNRLIEDLLDVSRIAAGKLRIERKPVRLRAALEGALEASSFARTARQIELVPLLAEADCLVMGDSGRLQQVFANLLLNAIKFSPSRSSITLAVAATPETVKVTVTDLGVGIEAEVLPHVFERFRQAHDSPQGPTDGLGLGLAIVRHIMNLHEGRVWAESLGKDRGSTFVVELPRLQES